MTKPHDPIARIEFMRNLLALIRQVRPTAPYLDRAHVRRMDAVILRDKFVAPRVGPDGPDFIGSQDRIAVSFTSWGDYLHYAASCFALGAAIALNLILSIVLRRAPAEVARVTASRVITRMQRMGTHERDGLSLFQGETMGLMGAPFAFGIAQHKLPVTVAIKRRLPQPAFFGASTLNLAVKPLVHRMYTIPLCRAVFKGPHA